MGKPTDKGKARRQGALPLSGLLPYLKPYRKHTILGPLFKLIEALLELFVVQLLREAVLNVTINKSILSSLYNEKSEEIAKDRDRANRFDSGLMSDTPEYLERYEAEGIKKLRR